MDRVLENKGFRYKWRMWMWGCVRNMNYSILINGSPTGSIKASRGMRQGTLYLPSCSFWLWMFQVTSSISGWMEAFLSLLRLVLRRWSCLIFSLQMIRCFFCSSKEDPFITLNHILGFFKAMSRLKINRSKCQILGINCGV